MFKYLPILPTLLIISVLTPAWSAEEEKSLWGENKRGFYLGGGYAATRIGYYEKTDCDYGYCFFENEYGSTESGFIVNAGYRFNRWLAVEVGYLDGGEPTFDETVYSFFFQGDTKIDVIQETTAVQLSVLGIVPIGNKWEIYLKGGVAVWDATSEQTIVPPDASTEDRKIDDDGVGLLLGGGVGYSPWKNLHLRVEFQTFETEEKLIAGDLIENNDVEVDAFVEAINFEVHWRFGDQG
jgi:opacity protein-like surface antigen